MKFALLNKQAYIYKIKSSNPLDWGLIPEATQEILSYMPLKSGDGVLTVKNSKLFLVLCVKDQAQGLYFTTTSREIDIQGPFPPTPIVHNGKIVEATFEAILQHFQGNFILEKEIKYLKECTEKFLTSPEVWDKPNLESIATQVFHTATADLPHTECRTEIVTETGETLRLKLGFSQSGFTFDFTGTSSSQNYSLTDKSTMGTIEKCLSRYLGIEEFACSKLFSKIQITKPMQCFLNGKHSDFASTQLLELIVFQAFDLLTPQKKSNFGNPLSARILLQWPEEKQKLTMVFNSRTPLDFSVQELEAKYPIQFTRIENKESLIVEATLLKPAQTQVFQARVKGSPLTPKVEFAKNQFVIEVRH